MNNKRAGIYAPVFYPGIVIMLVFLILGAGFPELLHQGLNHIQSWLILNLGWLYSLGVTGILAICLFLIFSRLGRIRLGHDQARPEHGYVSWFTMLFAAGMGIGLMFFGVAEPLIHYLMPPSAAPQTVAAARQAIEVTFLHWGLHAWGIYGLIAMALAYFSYRHHLPLLPRSTLYAVFGKRIYGPIGHIADITAFSGTIFGVATSMGLGVAQLNAGLYYLFNIPVSMPIQTILIAFIITLASISVLLGLNRGIKGLSNFNLALATLLLLFILLAGPTSWLLQTLIQGVGFYVNHLISHSLNLYAYQNNDAWVKSWTLFYWGWWISWSPFVGMFIARISKGRTIREFLTGVLFVPIGFVFLWMSVFGNSAINMIMHDQAMQLGNLVQHQLPVALFDFLSYYPLTMITSIAALVLIVVFFVTSADSGALVIDILASGNAPVSLAWQRVLWALLIGIIALVLLYSGGLEALQTVTLISAMPLLLVLLTMGYSLLKSLRAEYQQGHMMGENSP